MYDLTFIGRYRTHRTRSAAFAVVSFLALGMVPAQAEWTPVGSPGFSAGWALDPRLAVVGGEVYAAYSDGARGYRATVVRFDESSETWETVGTPGFSSGGVIYFDFASDGSTPYVAYSDEALGHKGVTQAFDGSVWQVVGSGPFSGGIANFIRLAVINTEPYVLYSDGTQTGDYSVERYDGSSWQYVPSGGFHPGASHAAALATLNNEPYVAVRDVNAMNRATVLRFDAGADAWQTVGAAGFSSGAVSDIRLAASASDPYIVYVDGAQSNRAVCAQFDGTDWTFLGPATGFTDGAATDCDIAMNGNQPIVVFKDQSRNGKATVMRYNGTAWEYCGYPGLSDGEVYYTTLIVHAGTPYVAFRDESRSRKLTVMKYVTPQTPTTPAASLVASDVATTQATLSWTNGNGTARAVFVKATDSGLPVPVDGALYTADATFGQGDELGTSGWYCVYAGTGTTVTLDGLSPGTSYRAMVCEYNGYTGDATYATDAATGNPLTFSSASATIQASDIRLTNGSPTEALIEWTNGNGTARAVFVRQGTSGTPAPAPDTTYTANATFGSGDQIGTSGWYCVYNGTGSTVLIDGLTPGVDYRVMVCEYDGVVGDELYLTTGATDNPLTITTPATLTQATGIVFTDVGATRGTITWTRGTGIARAVFVKAGTSGSAAPVDAVTYSPDLTFGRGDQIGGTGWFCVYNGNGAAVTVENLDPGVEYRVMVCEYQGPAGNEQYATATAMGNPSTLLPEIVSANLLVNPGAETGDLTGWTIIREAYEGWTSVTFEPQGGSRTFGTARDWCEREQVVDLLSIGFTADVLDNQPDITFREWVGPTTSWSGWYYLGVELRDGSDNVIASWHYGTATNPVLLGEDSPWALRGATLSEYGPGLRSIRVYDAGRWTQPTAGVHGPHFDEAVVRVDWRVPILTTASATNISTTAATGGGEVIAHGGDAVTARGLCWSASPDPTTADDVVTLGSGNGAFSTVLSGLAPGTQYHVRAWATNSIGTGYGDEQVFTTAVAIPTVTTAAITDVTDSGATSGGDVVDDGGGTITARGICWNTSGHPTTSDTVGSVDPGSGSFERSLAALDPNVTYYVRAYATNSAGTGYGDELAFTTSRTKPWLTTAAPRSVTDTAAVVGGTVTGDGGTAVTDRGVCWNTTGDPTLSDAHAAVGSGVGPFETTLENLQRNTTYYVRAYATNTTGTGYGTLRTFTTNATAAQITTHEATDIDPHSATVPVSVIHDGGHAIRAIGVCWNTTGAPTFSDARRTLPADVQTFRMALDSLLADTRYHVRAYAVTELGVSFGNEITFVTAAVADPGHRDADEHHQFDPLNGPDLRLTVTGPASTVQVGETLTLDIGVMNVGPGAASDVQVRVPLAAGLTFEVAHLVTGTDARPVSLDAQVAVDEIALALGDLAPTEVLELQVVLNTHAAGAVPIHAQASAAELAMPAAARFDTTVTDSLQIDPCTPFAPVVLVTILLHRLWHGPRAGGCGARTGSAIRPTR